MSVLEGWLLHVQTTRQYDPLVDLAESARNVARLFGGMMGGAAMAGLGKLFHFAKGGRWDSQIGRYVVVDENSEEWALGDNGQIQRLGVSEPEVVSPQSLRSSPHLQPTACCSGGTGARVEV